MFEFPPLVFVVCGIMRIIFFPIVVFGSINHSGEVGHGNKMTIDGRFVTLDNKDCHLRIRYSSVIETADKKFSDYAANACLNMKYMNWRLDFVFKYVSDFVAESVGKNSIICKQKQYNGKEFVQVEYGRYSEKREDSEVDKHPWYFCKALFDRSFQIRYDIQELPKSK